MTFLILGARESWILTVTAIILFIILLMLIIA